MDKSPIGYGPEGYWTAFHQTCPECGRSIVFLERSGSGSYTKGAFLAFPKGVARSPLPAEVDDQNVVEDYKEAASVLAESSKASAALSRRCLQYILRQKASVKQGDLSQEIQQVLDSNTLPSDIAQNLDAIRAVGNFGAHPIKSTNSGEIVDVEPHEAEWNLEVLEQLIDFYYTRPALAKKKREELNAKLADAGKPPMK